MEKENENPPPAQDAAVSSNTEVNAHASSSTSSSGNNSKRQRDNDDVSKDHSTAKKADTKQTASATAAGRINSTGAASMVNLEDCSDDDSDEKTNEPTCAICMETGSEESGKSIIPHNCPRCKKDAWSICNVCDEGRLSRACPVCNGDYAPLVLHALPSDAQLLQRVSHLPSGRQAECLKALQFATLRLITMSNVVVWVPAEDALKFSLPVDPTLPPTQIRYLLVTLPLTASTTGGAATALEAEVAAAVTVAVGGAAPSAPAALLASLRQQVSQMGQFHFSNGVWDQLESIMESGAGAGTGAGQGQEQVDIRGAMRFVMGALTDSGSAPGGSGTGSAVATQAPVLFACISPAEMMAQLAVGEDEEHASGGTA